MNNIIWMEKERKKKQERILYIGKEIKEEREGGQENELNNYFQYPKK